MLTAVFVIAVLNLGVGFAVSALVDGPWGLVVPTLPWRRWNQRRRPLDALAVASDASAEFALPPDWTQRIEQAEIVAQGPAESVLWAAQLGAVDARHVMLELDRGWHANAELAIEQLQEVGSQWLEHLEQWSTALAVCKECPEFGTLARDVEERLLDQHFQAKSVWQELLESESGGAPVGRLLAEMLSTFDAVRESTMAALCLIRRRQDRRETLSEMWRIDEPSGALSRLEMESLFDDWLREDPDMVRIASCALIDVDRMSKINESIGAVSADLALAFFGELLYSQIRKDRGFDRIVRYRGESYLLFFGDTAAANAASSAERIRQTVEASSFQVRGQEIEFSATFSVAELKRGEPVGDLLVRLEAGLAGAKAAGRNRTFVDGGTGPQPVRLPQYEVERREFELAEEPCR